MRDMRPDSLVLELCDDRYERWLKEVIAHPNYDSMMQTVHNILDKKPHKLTEYKEIDIEDSNLEYLVGLDYCSYRLPCKTILGDRSYNMTRKRHQSKLEMLDVYKEALSLDKPSGKHSGSKSNIFDVDESNSKGVGLENSVEQLKQALNKAKQLETKTDSEEQLIKSLQ